MGKMLMVVLPMNFLGLKIAILSVFCSGVASGMAGSVGVVQTEISHQLLDLFL